jgi:hypothetical protein
MNRDDFFSGSDNNMEFEILSESSDLTIPDEFQ